MRVGELTCKWHFVSMAALGMGAFATWRSPASLGVGIAPSPLHPNAPSKEPAEFGVQALQRPREAETQSASHESPLMCGLKKIDKTGKMKSPLLCPAMSLNTARFPARIHLCFKGRTSRTWNRGAALVALLLWWVWVGESVELYTRPRFLPSAAKYCQYFTLSSLLMARKSADCFRIVAMERTRISWVIFACVTLGFSARKTY